MQEVEVKLMEHEEVTPEPLAGETGPTDTQAAKEPEEGRETDTGDAGDDDPFGDPEPEEEERDGIVIGDTN